MRIFFPTTDRTLLSADVMGSKTMMKYIIILTVFSILESKVYGDRKRQRDMGGCIKRWVERHREMGRRRERWVERQRYKWMERDGWRDREKWLYGERKEAATRTRSK